MTVLADAVGNVVVFALAVTSWTFLGYFFFRVRWEVTTVGRGLFAFMLIVALMMTLGALRVVFGEFVFFVWVRSALLLGILAIFVGAVVLLVSTQRAARAERARHRR
jgi:hypothetical protein